MNSFTGTTTIWSFGMPLGVLFQATNGVERASGIYPEFYLTPMEKVKARETVRFGR